MEPSEEIEESIRKKANWLEKYYSKITSLRVLIEPSYQRHKVGNLYHVRLDITVPGKEIIVGRDPKANHAHENPHVAIRDAFRAAKRQLQGYVRSRFKAKVRHQEKPPQGKVIRLFPEDECGFIETFDGREVYFHKNSVIDNKYQILEIGDEVQYAEEMGNKGPQASSVYKRS